jgi:VWFA-related protein
MLTVAAVGGAQTATPPPQAPARETAPEIRLRTERNLVLVGVVVRDAKGQPVRDLRKEDFRLFDDGEPQEISGFSVEVSSPSVETAGVGASQPVQAAAGVAPANASTPVPEHFIVLFFDDLHGKSDDFWRSRDAAWRYITTSTRAQDHIAIVTASGKHQVDFTYDQSKLHDSLFHIAPSGQHFSGCPEISEFEAYLVYRVQSREALTVVHSEALQCACGAGSGAPDQSDSVGIPSTMQHSAGHADCERAAGRDAEIKAAAVWSSAESQARRTLQALENSVRHLAAMAGERSLVLVSSGFLTETQADKIDSLINDALQQDVVISAIYAPGLEMPLPEESFDQLSPATDATKNGLTNMASAYLTRSLGSLSSGTGGVFFYNHNDFENGFRLAAGMPEVMYLLSFSPRDLKLDGKLHSLKVTLSNREHVSVRARRGYFASR